MSNGLLVCEEGFRSMRINLQEEVEPLEAACRVHVHEDEGLVVKRYLFEAVPTMKFQILDKLANFTLFFMGTQCD